MKVSDIMIKDVITVREDTMLKEAAGLLAKFHIHAMPVVDPENKVVGIITESDFFIKDASNIYLPTFLDFIGREAGDAEKLEIYPNIEKKSTVKDVMTKECITVKADLPLSGLIALIKEKNLNSVPVVDENNGLVGIATVFDIIRLL